MWAVLLSLTLSFLFNYGVAWSFGRYNVFDVKDQFWGFNFLLLILGTLILGILMTPLMYILLAVLGL